MVIDKGLDETTLIWSMWRCFGGVMIGCLAVPEIIVTYHLLSASRTPLPRRVNTNSYHFLWTLFEAKRNASRNETRPVDIV
eukprot:scaffold126672_cov47-Attheya_sp.AAC.1